MEEILALWALSRGFSIVKLARLDVLQYRKKQLLEEIFAESKKKSIQPKTLDFLW